MTTREETRQIDVDLPLLPLSQASPPRLSPPQRPPPLSIRVASLVAQHSQSDSSPPDSGVAMMALPLVSSPLRPRLSAHNPAPEQTPMTAPIDVRPRGSPDPTSVTSSLTPLGATPSTPMGMDGTLVVGTPSSGGDVATGVAVEFAKKKKKRRPIKPVEFEDKYELTGVLLGTGASCEVHECRARDGAPGLFAAKIVSKKCDAVTRDQVFKEVELLMECRGQLNILQLMDFYEGDLDFRLVFEKVEGGELLAHIQERKSFTENEASRVTRDIATALAFLHARGIAHRDLKPQNILCVFKDKASPAKLADFNLGAVTRHTPGDITPPITIPVGTPDFMPPEVVDALAGAECRYDKRCDSWSLGVILYIMLSGKPPFTGECGADCGWAAGAHCDICQDLMYEQISDGRFDFPPADWRHISGAAKDLIARLLVREQHRLTADQILRHPWIAQEPPRTELLTPGELRGKKLRESLDEFASEANAVNRKVDSFTGAPGTHTSARGSMVAALQRNSFGEAMLPQKSKPVMVPSSFTSVLSQALMEIHTPVKSAAMPIASGRRL